MRHVAVRKSIYQREVAVTSEEREWKERAKRVRNYFAGPRKVPIRDFVKAGIGIVLLAIGANVAFLAVIGLLVLLWGGVGIVRYGIKMAIARPKATDLEMDTWRDAACRRRRPRGLTPPGRRPSRLRDLACRPGWPFPATGSRDLPIGTCSVHWP